MKTTSKFLVRTVLILTLSTLVMTSCSEEESSNTESSVTDEEVQEILKSSLVDEGGIIADFQTSSASLNGNFAGRTNEQSFAIAMDLNAVNCNQTVSNSFQNSNTVGDRSWTILTDWSWTLNCDQQNNSISFNLNGNGSLEFEGPNLSKDISRTHQFIITGIEPSSTEWIYNADHTREGFIQSNVGNQNSMNTILTYGSTDIVVSKANQQILSGTFEISFSATLPNGNIVTRGATLVFNGNQNANVVLDNGFTFNISW